MATTKPSKYAENQFPAATYASFPLMSEVLADTVPRATTAIAGNAAFAAVMAALNGAATSWSAGESVHVAEHTAPVSQRAALQSGKCAPSSASSKVRYCDTSTTANPTGADAASSTIS